MSRWKEDEVDIWCTLWAQTRRKIKGIILEEMLMPAERLGKMRSTLGRIEAAEQGATDTGSANQDWPEVYTGLGLLIHRAWVHMPQRKWQLIQDAHYVWRELPVKLKAPECGVEVRDYFAQLELLKAYLLGYVTHHRDADEYVARVERSPCAVRLFG